MSEERLQKFLARAGVASRRAAETLIVDGRVRVNNVTVRELGTKVVAGRDLVTLDGKLISLPEGKGYFLLYKPVGVVTTLSDPQGRKTVKDLLGRIPRRVYPVGRLDYDAEGALLLTDDGDIALRLTHPRFGVDRRYLAKVKGEPEEEALERLRKGVRLEDGAARAKTVRVYERADKNTWLELVVSEGRPHLIKRLCAAVGHPVVRLFRPTHAGIGLEGLQPGEWRPLRSTEIESLRAVGQGAVPPEPAFHLPARRHGRAEVRAEGDETPRPPARFGRGFESPRRSSTGRDAGAGRGARPPGGRAPLGDESAVPSPGPRGGGKPSRGASSPRGSAAPRGSSPRANASPRRGAKPPPGGRKTRPDGTRRR